MCHLFLFISIRFNNNPFVNFKLNNLFFTERLCDLFLIFPSLHSLFLAMLTRANARSSHCRHMMMSQNLSGNSGHCVITPKWSFIKEWPKIATSTENERWNDDDADHDKEKTPEKTATATTTINDYKQLKWYTRRMCREEEPKTKKKLKTTNHERICINCFSKSKEEINISFKCNLRPKVNDDDESGDKHSFIADVSLQRALSLKCAASGA